MRTAHSLAAAGLILAAGLAVAIAETAGGHAVVPQADITWGAAPP